MFLLVSCYTSYVRELHVFKAGSMFLNEGVGVYIELHHRSTVCILPSLVSSWQIRALACAPMGHRCSSSTVRLETGCFGGSGRRSSHTSLPTCVEGNHARSGRLSQSKHAKIDSSKYFFYRFTRLLHRVYHYPP
jgi:hypothetical protein